MLEKEITVELLELDGTEKFTAMRDLYIKNGDGYILMYSVTSLNEFNELDNQKEQILRVNDSDEVPMVLVGTYKREKKNYGR